MPAVPITEIQPHEQVLLIAVNKRSLDEDSTRTLVDDVHTAAAQRPGPPIVLDLSKVKFAPSVALGSMVKLAKSYDFDGRRMAIIGVNRNIEDAMRVTSLDKILRIHNTLEQAIKGSA